MSSTASNYNLSRLSTGLSLAALATVAGIATVSTILYESRVTGLWTSLIFVAYGIMMFGSSYVEEEQHFWYWASSSWLGWLVVKRLVLHSIVRCGLLISCRRNAVTLPDSLDPWFTALLLVFLRLVRVWNQTGQKHTGEPDIARTALPAHNILLWLLVFVTYLDVIQRLSRRAMPWASRHLATAASLALGIAALGFKVAFTKADTPHLFQGLEYLIPVPLEEASLVAQARAVFTSIAMMVLVTSFPAVCQRAWGRRTTKGRAQSKPTGHLLTKINPDISRPVHDLFTLFLLTQSRATNIPLFLLLEMQYQALDLLRLSCIELTLTCLLFQHVSFFAFGGSNAISSIDLSNAYNGIDGYKVVAVGVLTFCGNWAGPLWWTSATALLLSKGDKRHQKWARHLSLLTTFVSSSLLFVMLACTALRTHIFIWTVFSPKYLYSMAWSMGQHLCVDIGYGSLLFWIGSW